MLKTLSLSSSFVPTDYFGSVMNTPGFAKLDTCSNESFVKSDDLRGKACGIGLGEQLTGQVELYAKQTVPKPKGSQGPFCYADLGQRARTQRAPCPGNFRFIDAIFPLPQMYQQKVEFTVTGEQRFFDLVQQNQCKNVSTTTSCNNRF